MIGVQFIPLSDWVRARPKANHWDECVGTAEGCPLVFYWKCWAEFEADTNWRVPEEVRVKSRPFRAKNRVTPEQGLSPYNYETFIVFLLNIVTFLLFHTEPQRTTEKNEKEDEINQDFSFLCVSLCLRGSV